MDDHVLKSKLMTDEARAAFDILVTRMQEGKVIGPELLRLFTNIVVIDALQLLISRTEMTGDETGIYVMLGLAGFRTMDRIEMLLQETIQ